MIISENISLKPYNTFGIDVNAAGFLEASTSEELVNALQQKGKQYPLVLILGGGSNILFTQDVNGLVVKNSLKGINIVKEDNDYVWVEAGAGEVWHQLVLWSIEHNLGGIENLSLIPGNVGAGPMQNIGAYGVELKDTFDELEALNISTLQIKKFSAAACNFGYRESVFKNVLKGQYIICSVTLKLRKKPIFNISYGAIEQELKKMGVEQLSIKAISDAVIHIRQSKLPDPAKLGNAGSFFKNPEVEEKMVIELRENYPNLVAYPTVPGRMKVAAGWLIEQCGWKGKRVGNTGAHKDQALVLVNYGNATGKEVYDLALDIKKSVADKFSITIEPEVNVV